MSRPICKDGMQEVDHKVLRELENGYTVIAEKPDDGRGQMAGTIVLAVNVFDDGMVQYATWWCRSEDDVTIDGNYFNEHQSGSIENAFFKAVTDFILRKK